MENTNLYSNGKIYKLVCSDGYYYIGSTRNTLQLRLLDHKKAARIHPERQLYSHLLQLGWDNVYITLIENYSCSSKKELNKHEDTYIQEAKNKKDKLCLNINRAQITKDELKEHQKQYREQNKEHISEYKAQYRQLKADEIAEYNKAYVQENEEVVKERRRRYYEENKEAIAAKNMEYARKNREVVNARKIAWQKAKYAKGKEERDKLRAQKKEKRIADEKETVMCDCGGKYQMFHKNRHFASKRHVSWISTAPMTVK